MFLNKIQWMKDLRETVNTAPKGQYKKKLSGKRIKFGQDSGEQWCTDEVSLKYN